MIDSWTVVMYSINYDGYMVTKLYPSGGPFRYFWQYRAIPEWRELWAVRNCPSERRPYNIGSNQHHYGVNIWIDDPVGGGGFPKLARIKYPEKITWAGDSDLQYNMGAVYGSPFYHISNMRHTGGINMLFVDGHVEWWSHNQFPSGIYTAPTQFPWKWPGAPYRLGR